MLINCNPRCPGKRATTNGLLDLESNEVICEYCKQIIPTSSFTKKSMEQRGEIIRVDKRKPYQFDCLTCGKLVETELSNSELKGITCQKDCQFNVSDFTLRAMKLVQENKKKDDE